jgi:hypothetical protein
VQLGGSGALHAAFLNESRIRGRVQSSVLEIRGMGDMLLTGTQLTNRTGMYGKPVFPGFRLKSRRWKARMLLLRPMVPHRIS